MRSVCRLKQEKSNTPGAGRLWFLGPWTEHRTDRGETPGARCLRKLWSLDTGPGATDLVLQHLDAAKTERDEDGDSSPRPRVERGHAEGDDARDRHSGFGGRK